MPGFEYEDMEVKGEGEMCGKFPGLREIIMRSELREMLSSKNDE